MLLATRKADQNHAAVDPWTAVHAAAGLAFGLVGTGFWPAVALAVAFDVAEQGFERTPAGQRFFKTSGPESVGNVVADMGAFAVGWYLGDRWNRT